MVIMGVAIMRSAYRHCLRSAQVRPWLPLWPAIGQQAQTVGL